MNYSSKKFYYFIINFAQTGKIIYHNANLGAKPPHIKYTLKVFYHIFAIFTSILGNFFDKKFFISYFIIIIIS